MNKEETKWLGQYLSGENLWYVTEHTDDGIGAELFFHTMNEVSIYVNEHNIIVDWE